jgi:hypothetical protein
MIAQAGLLSYRMGFQTPLAKSTCTQRLVPQYYGLVLHKIIICIQDFGLTKCMLHGDLERLNHHLFYN